MRLILILVGMLLCTGCLRDPDRIKEKAYEQLRNEYLALLNPKDQHAVEAFDQLFDAERFRRKYWIHAGSTETNRLWWYPVKDPLGSPRYTCYLKPAISLVPHLDNGIFRIHPDAPITRDNADEALRAGYASLENSGPVADLAAVSAVIASREGNGAEDMWFMTAVVDLKGELFALAVMTREKYRDEVVKHVADLLAHARQSRE